MHNNRSGVRRDIVALDLVLYACFVNIRLELVFLRGYLDALYRNGLHGVFF